MVEYQLPKLTAWVRFPSPAPHAPIAQAAERIHGKDEVSSSNLDGSSTLQGLKIKYATLLQQPAKRN